MSDSSTPKPADRRPVSSGDYDIEARYLAEISRYPLLTAEEEVDLARRARAGDEEARRRLIISNLRLVVTIARRYLGRGHSLMDLVEEGNLGLIKAAARFDPERGFRFSTYASWWIKQSITRGMANQSRTLRVPVHIFQLINRFIREEDTFQGRTPSDEEIAARLGISVKKARLVRKLITGIRGDEPLISAEALQKLAADAYYRNTHSPEETVTMQLEHQHMLDLVEKHLSEREQAILTMRYGLDGDEPKTLAEVGEIIGVSRERVRQLEKRALQKLNLMLSSPPGGGKLGHGSHLRRHS